MNKRYTEKLLNRIRQDYLQRMDAKEEGEWKTAKKGPAKGKKFHMNESGEIDKGNPYVVASMEKRGAKVSSSMHESIESARKSMEERKPKAKAVKEASSSVASNGTKPRPKKEMGTERIIAEHPNLNESKEGYISKANASKVGNIKGGKNGDFTAKSDTSKLIDTKDAMGELKKGTINSLAEFMDKDGNLSPERQKVHDDIVESYFKDKIKYDGQPTMIMSGGGPASGKSFVTKNAVGKFDGADSLIKIDPDEIKQMLPGFENMAKDYYEGGADESKNMNAAAFYHEESSALAKRIYAYALENGLNVVYDGTGDGSIGSVAKKIQQARDAGCKVEGEYVTINNDEAVKRNRGRYEHGVEEYEKAKSNGGLNEKGEKVPAPRLVPDDVVLGTHQKVTDISVEVAKMFDKYTLFDNNGKAGEQVAIAECVGDGKLKAIKGQEKRLQAFLDKGLGKYRIAEDGTVETIESADEVRKRASQKR